MSPVHLTTSLLLLVRGSRYLFAGSVNLPEQLTIKGDDKVCLQTNIPMEETKQGVRGDKATELPALSGQRSPSTPMCSPTWNLNPSLWGFYGGFTTYT